MRRARDGAALGAVLAILAVLAAGCGRSGPGAPVEYKGSGDFALPSASVRTLSGFPEPVDGRIEVVPGDTVHSIARRTGVAPEQLIAANRLEPPYRLQVGQILVITPPTQAARPDGEVHVVTPGETVFRISRCTGRDMEALVRLNAIEPPYVIMVGQRLRLPEQVAPASCPPPLGERSAQPPPQPADDPAARGSEMATASRHPDDSAMAPPAIPAEPAVRPAVVPAAVPGPVPPPPPRSAGKFLWPVSGRLVAGFGPQPDGGRNDGVNVAAPRGTPVRAAESGTVVYAGNELRGYGQMLLIRHEDGWITAYAHNEALLVGRGDVVERGQPIARVGTSGGVAEPQVHFELRRGAKAVDPTAHLSWE